MSENLNRAIKHLENARALAAEELINEPNLSVRVDKTLETLVNGLRHISGQVAAETHKLTNIGVQPAKTFMGLNLQKIEEQKEPAKVEVGASELEKFNADVQSLYANFIEREDNELKETVRIELLLGVAKLAGLEFENPSKVQPSIKLVKEIKAAIRKKAETDAAREAKIKELGKTEGGE